MCNWHIFLGNETFSWHSWSSMNHTSYFITPITLLWSECSLSQSQYFEIYVFHFSGNLITSTLNNLTGNPGQTNNTGVTCWVTGLQCMCVCVCVHISHICVLCTIWGGQRASSGCPPVSLHNMHMYSHVYYVSSCIENLWICSVRTKFSSSCTSTDLYYGDCKDSLHPTATE